MDGLNAVEENRLDIYLQPMVTLPQRKVRFYEAVTRLRDDKDQILAAVEGRVVSANSAGADRIQTVAGEINELGVLVKQLAVAVASHEDMLAAGAATAQPQPASLPEREAQSELPDVAEEEEPDGYSIRIL